MSELSPLSNSPSADRWSETVTAARGGSRAAMEQLFREVRGYLRSRAAAQLDPALQAKVSPSDVVQETLLEAYQAFDRFDGLSRADLLVWLQGIMKNQLRTTRRHYRSVAKRDIRREVVIDSGDGQRSRWSPRDQAGGTPSQDAVRNEEAERLARAMARLSERHEQVVRLRNELRLSFAEIAAVLECSEDAAQKLWSRAIDRLSQELRDVQSHT